MKTFNWLSSLLLVTIYFTVTTKKNVQAVKNMTVKPTASPVRVVTFKVPKVTVPTKTTTKPSLVALTSKSTMKVPATTGQPVTAKTAPKTTGSTARAKVAPGTVTPATLTPASLTPATLTPITLAPAILTPATLAPVTPSPTTSPTTTQFPTTLAHLCVPSCPAVECTTNSNLFNSQGVLIEPKKYGRWKTCGKKYLFREEKKNISEAMKLCCSIGMRLLSVETARELECFNTFKSDDPSLPISYITSGTDIGCLKEKSFKWCSSNLMFTKNAAWRIGEPNNFPSKVGVEACVELVLSEDIKGWGPSGINDMPCNLEYNVICEELTTIPPTTCAPSCAPVVCTTDKSLFSQKGLLIDPTVYGVWKSACKVDYLFAIKKNMNHIDATKFCCSVGMKLLSVETYEEWKCLFSIYQDDKSLSKIYMTSGTDAGCQEGKKFKWCSSNSMFSKDMPWRDGEPNNYEYITGGEACVELLLTSDTIGFNDMNCATERPVICEAPQAGIK